MVGWLNGYIVTLLHSYIVSLLNSWVVILTNLKNMLDCVFCKIVAEEIPAEKIYEDEQAFVFLDISPVNPGHCLVVPKEHYEDSLTTPEELLSKMLLVGKKIAKALKESGLAEGVYFGMNNGAAAGQLVFHTHLHVIPRLKSDGLKMWGSGKYKSDEEKKRVLERIKKIL